MHEENRVQSANMEAMLHDAGFRIVENMKNSKDLRLIEKALGVLANDGLYACYVFCLSLDSKKDKETNNENRANVIQVLFENPLKKIALILNDEFKNTINYLEQCSKNLNKLMIVKEMLEKIYIYARYHAQPELKTRNE